MTNPDTNSGTRYFYTDPLAAAWQAKHFGMMFIAQFTAEHGLTDKLYETPYEEWEWGEHIIHYSGEKVYIHPGSLHLLDAQDGDEGTDAYGMQCYFMNGEWKIPHPRASSADEYATEPVAIDKRNGKAFHWPEKRPVMTRFFYPASRSHHAYVMAIDHGMEFERRFGKWPTEGLLHVTGKLYVHPDSLGLLEPRVSDMVTYNNGGDYGRIHEFQNNGSMLLIPSTSGDDFSAGTAEVDFIHAIIQRAGLPFYHPEQEI